MGAAPFFHYTTRPTSVRVFESGEGATIQKEDA